MQKPLLDENDEKIVSISRRSKTVSTSNQYARMSVIADTLASCLASINCRLVLLAVTVPSEWLRRSKPAAPRLLCLKLTQLTDRKNLYLGSGKPVVCRIGCRWPARKRGKDSGSCSMPNGCT
ncbi:hypothetical protein EMIT0194P_200058 [Pseudomonas serbica]